MRISKRQFLKMGMGGAAAVFLGPLLRPGSLFASPVVLPPNYLESSIHGYWMRLSYNQGRESRQTRRTIGAALRNLGAIRGQGRGYELASAFDQAVETAFQRWLITGRRSTSLFGLVQRLYDESIYPRSGPAGGRALFGSLLSMLRGRDGTPRGEAANQGYLAYRRAALEYKNAYRTMDHPEEIEAAREKRARSLALWQQQLNALVDSYAFREIVLRRDYPIEPDMLEGFEIYLAPLRISAPHLTLSRTGGQIIISWKGGATLQQAPTVRGPWRTIRNSSPVALDIREERAFFRTVTAEPDTSP